MNRREALLALTGLPAVTRISRTDLKPDDVIVIESDQILSNDTISRIKDFAQQVWPGRKVIVLADGLKMKVVAGT